ncbi:MAG: hypothetical protein ACFFDM_09880 [Candidatus Thorarchaeota archaeon]
MQSGYLIITFGFQMFLLVGYLFYFTFRKWLAIDDQITLMTWTAVLVGILTFGLSLLVLIVLPRMQFTEAIMASVIVFVDIVGLYLLAKETWNRKMTIEHGLFVEET